METFLEFPSPELIRLPEKLKPDQLPVWGTMSPQHMIEHVILTLRISSGKIDVPLSTPEDKVERVKNLILLGPHPLKRDFQAPFLMPGLQPLEFESMLGAIRALDSEIQAFELYWQQNPDSQRIHPVFGRLGKEEWVVFHRKHFTHHYLQFGLI